MNLGLLLTIARPSELLSTHSTRVGVISESQSRQVVLWAGAKARKIIGLDEVSAAGTPGETGVILLSVPDASEAGRAGFLADDVILAIDSKPVKDIQDLMRNSRQIPPGGSVSVTVIRYQQESAIKIQLK
ncbi:MAG: PDZ domain-containing protein [Terracidiphilus sp.]